MSAAVAIAKATAETLKVGDPFAADTRLGPVVSEAQWKKIQSLIETGIKEGATVVAGWVVGGRSADRSLVDEVHPDASTTTTSAPASVKRAMSPLSFVS